jgi:UDP-N-acetylmuramoylalanine--D-glutamate ligase
MVAVMSSLKDAEQQGKVMPHTLVVGLGATGVAVANFLAARGARVRVIDSRELPPGLDVLRARGTAVDIVTGSLDSKWLDGVEEVVLSPGLSVDIPLVREARHRGLEVISDIELFARHCHAPVIAVTGSNGKSTVTALVAAMLAADGRRIAAGGNLGPPALDLLAEPAADAYVLEVSSFQMETTEHLHPLAAAVLNVSADHLDRHATLERYAGLKGKLLHAAQIAVVNWDDPIVRGLSAGHAHTVFFSVDAVLEQGYSVLSRNGERWLACDAEPLLPSAQLTLRGVHNEANALAALALCRALGPTSSRMLAALQSFKGLPHRCEWIRELRGVTYIDDSKGTNVGATEAALRGLPGPLVLIAGGLGKGADFNPLRTAAAGKLRAAVLIGRDAPALAAALEGLCPLYRAATLPEAVATAHAQARPGDSVLLSPACASLDMFEDYRHRGRVFADAVRELAE